MQTGGNKRVRLDETDKQKTGKQNAEGGKFAPDEHPEQQCVRRVLFRRRGNRMTARIHVRASVKKLEA
ncbi:hypothetical protein D9M72_605210 [compost metagenome]